MISRFVLLLVLGTVACAAPPVPPTPTDEFWTRLTAPCDKAFEGRIVEVPAGDTAFTNRALVMHARACGADSIRIPFQIATDRSRTWVITRSEGGLRLRHDHRHGDGSPGAMEFPADSFTAALIPLARTNVWSLEVDPDRRRLSYALRREGTDRRLRVEFDLGRAVPAPPPPWGS